MDSDALGLRQANSILFTVVVWAMGFVFICTFDTT